VSVERIRYRHEQFGGIVATDDPPLLAYVDRDFMREISPGESPLWVGAPDSSSELSAPVEVHFTVTDACPAGCAHCFKSSVRHDGRQMNLEQVRRALRVLGDMGVFHIAIAGGEPLMRPDFFEIAESVLSLDVRPTLTLSGAIMSAETANRLRRLGQINVSMDGIGPCYSVFRDPGLFEKADAALDLLVGNGVRPGINCVVSRKTFDGIPELFEYAEKKGVSEIAFLRLKPFGRGRRDYYEHRTTPGQNERLAPMVASLSEKHQIASKFDCSLMPMLCRHRPDKETLERFCVQGCEAGSYVIGISSDGFVSGCGFLAHGDISILDLPGKWKEDEYLNRLRSCPNKIKEPCASCEYLSVCRGGCRAVADFVTGSVFEPDPECHFFRSSQA